MNNFILLHLQQNNIGTIVRIDNISYVEEELDHNASVYMKGGICLTVKESVDEIFKMINK